MKLAVYAFIHLFYLTFIFISKRRNIHTYIYLSAHLSHKAERKCGNEVLRLSRGDQGGNQEPPPPILVKKEWREKEENGKK